jgi:hypothetical protein
MRQVWAVLSLGFAIAALAGCNSTRWPSLRPSDPNTAAKPPDGGLQSVESLLAYLNENASRLQSIQATSLEVTATQGQSINLRGKMVAEKPRGFRMSLDGPLGFAQVADLGSNADEFWFWIKAPMGQPPAPQYFCSYKDLERGVPFMPVPFQPQWVMETLGMGPYSPPERYTLEHDDKMLRLIEKTRSPQGNVVRKVIVMNRRATKAPEPQITHYLLIDDTTGKEICSAHITQTMVAAAGPDRGVVIPKKLDLYWRQQNATLSIILDRVAVNVSLPPQAFVRQPLSGVQSQNLARGPANAAGLQPVQGLQPR